MASHRRTRPADRCRSGSRRRAADDGGRTDLRLGRRHGRRRMELHRHGPEQTPASRRFDQAAAQQVWPRRVSALRPGEMVSRRTTATLGPRLLLAQGWRAGLGRFGPAGRRDRPFRPRRKHLAKIHHGPGRATGRRHRLRRAGLRRRLALSVARTPVAGQRRSAGFAADRPGRARAAGTHLRTRLGNGRGSCAAAGAR